MAEKHITPSEHRKQVQEAVDLALLAFDTCDLDAHLDAIDKLYVLEEAEKAKELHSVWVQADEWDAELSNTFKTAYYSAIGIIRV